MAKNPLARYARSSSAKRNDKRRPPLPPAVEAKKVIRSIDEAARTGKRRPRRIATKTKPGTMRRRGTMRRPPNPRTMRRPSDPNPFSIADPKEAPRDNLYNKARRAENAKRAASGKQPLQSQLKQLAKLGRAVGYASKAIPVAGTVASAYDVAQQLGGPPTKDPKKFKNYKRLVRRGYRAK